MRSDYGLSDCGLPRFSQCTSGLCIAGNNVLDKSNLQCTLILMQRKLQKRFVNP